jgi:hypothetical protein
MEDQNAHNRWLFHTRNVIATELNSWLSTNNMDSSTTKFGFVVISVCEFLRDAEINCLLYSIRDVQEKFPESVV